MVSDDIFIVFERVVRIENEAKPELTVNSFSNLNKKEIPHNLPSPMISKSHDSNFSVDDRLQILTNNDLDYDFGIDEITALYGSDHDEGIGTESPRSDYVSVKEDISPQQTRHVERKIIKSHVIEKVSSNPISKKRKSDRSDFSRKIVKTVDRILKIDSSTSRHFKDILERTPTCELEKLNLSNHIDMLMQLSFIAHDFETTQKESRTSVKAHKVVVYLKNCIRSFVDKSDPRSIHSRLTVPKPPITNPSTSTQNSSIPTRTYISFEKWTNPSGDLYMEKVCDVAVGKVSNPLGCAYDTTLGFLFTGQSDIYRCSLQGEFSDIPMIGELRHPSAIVVIRPGELLGVLDRSGIYVFDLLKLIKFVVASGLNGMCRGLAITDDGFLLTCGRVQGVSTIILYDPKEENNVVKSFPFPVIKGAYSAPNPCFISSKNGSAYITDLGQNCVVCVNSRTLDILFVQDLSKSTSPSVKFNFVSGIVMDSRNNLLVADAQNRSLYYLDGLCRKGRPVKVLKGVFPYSASFDVSPCGRLLACCRKTNSMALFKITGVDNDSAEQVAAQLFGLK